MEVLAPPHLLLIEVCHSIRAGEGLRSGILGFVREYENDFTGQVKAWLVRVEQNSLSPEFFRTIDSPQRRVLLETLSHGFAGKPILETLTSLEQEFEELSRLEMENQLQKLPFKMMIPLLLFQFPAIFILLIGPVLMRLLEELGN